MNWRKQTIILLALLLALLALAACQGEATPAPTATAVPTLAAPTAAPTEAPTAKPTVAPTEAPTEAAAAASTSVGAWEPVACDTLVVGPEVAAVADCGYVTVPESRTSGSDRQIKLAVVRVRATGDDPGAPIVLGTGGPGGGGLDSVRGAQGPGFLTTYCLVRQEVAYFQ